MAALEKTSKEVELDLTFTWLDTIFTHLAGLALLAIGGFAFYQIAEWIRYG